MESLSFVGLGLKGYGPVLLLAQILSPGLLGLEKSPLYILVIVSITVMDCTLPNHEPRQTFLPETVSVGTWREVANDTFALDNLGDLGN